MITGTIKNWDGSKGWGFIIGDDGNDYFLHTSKIRIGQSVSINCRVKFDVSQGQRGPEAQNVTLY